MTPIQVTSVSKFLWVAAGLMIVVGYIINNAYGAEPIRPKPFVNQHPYDPELEDELD